jgi:hypothetical protein
MFLTPKQQKNKLSHEMEIFGQEQSVFFPPSNWTKVSCRELQGQIIYFLHLSC